MSCLYLLFTFICLTLFHLVTKSTHFVFAAVKPPIPPTSMLSSKISSTRRLPTVELCLWLYYCIIWLWFEIIFCLFLSQEDGLKGFFSQSKLTGENQVYCDECEAKADTTTVSNSITDWMYHHLNTEVLTRLRPFLYSLLPLGIWSRTTSRGSCAAAQEIWVQLQRNGLR